MAMTVAARRPTGTPTRQRGGQRAGFAMISVIIAVVMIATGAMALAAANTTRMRYQTTSRTVALNIARDYHELVRARNPFTLGNEAEARVDANGNVAANGDYTRELKVTSAGYNLLTVEIIVGVPRGGVPVRLLTSIYRGARPAPRT